MKSIVYVTENEISEGEPNSGVFCPVALAIAQLLKPGYDCDVTDCQVIFSYEESTIDATGLPPCAQEAIHAYDHGAEMQPFHFSLDIPEEATA